MNLHDFLELGIATTRTDPQDEIRMERLRQDLESCAPANADDPDYAGLMSVMHGLETGRCGQIVPREVRVIMLPLCKEWHNWGDGRDNYVDYLLGERTFENASAGNPRLLRFDRLLKAWVGSEDVFDLSRGLLLVIEGVNQYLGRLRNGKRRESREWTVEEPIYTLWTALHS